MSPEVYKLLGILSFVTGWLAIALLLFTQEVKKDESISSHAANNKNSFVMMALLESVSLTLFTLFTVKWMAPTLQLPWVFSVCCTVIAIGLITAAWLPVTGPQARLHDFAAYGASLLFIPVIFMLAISSEVGSTATLINSLALIGLIVILFMTRVKAVQKYHLLLQSAYIFIFDIALLAAAFLK